jgi:hypothetical protein
VWLSCRYRETHAKDSVNSTWRPVLIGRGCPANDHLRDTLDPPGHDHAPNKDFQPSSNTYAQKDTLNLRASKDMLASVDADSPPDEPILTWASRTLSQLGWWQDSAHHIDMSASTASWGFMTFLLSVWTSFIQDALLTGFCWLLVMVNFLPLLPFHKRHRCLKQMAAVIVLLHQLLLPFTTQTHVTFHENTYGQHGDMPETYPATQPSHVFSDPHFETPVVDMQVFMGENGGLAYYKTEAAPPLFELSLEDEVFHAAGHLMHVLDEVTQSHGANPPPAGHQLAYASLLEQLLTQVPDNSPPPANQQPASTTCQPTPDHLATPFYMLGGMQSNTTQPSGTNLLEQLLSMGFPRWVAMQACQRFPDSLEAASNYCLGSEPRHRKPRNFIPPPAQEGQGQESAVTCVRCDNYQSASARFCSNCGTERTPGASAASRTPAQVASPYAGAPGTFPVLPDNVTQPAAICFPQADPLQPAVGAGDVSRASVAALTMVKAPGAPDFVDDPEGRRYHEVG